MANNDGFVEYVSEQEYQRLSLATKELIKQSEIIEVINKKSIGANTPSKSDAIIKELTAAYKAQEQQINALQSKLNVLAQTRANNVVTLKQEGSAIANNSKNTRENSIAQQILRNETDRNYRASTLLAGAYARASAQLLILKKEAKDAFFQFGEGSKQFKVAAAAASDLDKRLKEADKSVGDSQRNVGNYAGALQGVWSGLRQIAMILPGIGLAGLFGLALDPLFDLIKGLGLFNDKFAEMKQNFNEFVDTQAKIRTGTRAAKEDFKALYDLATNPNAPLEEQNKAVQDLKKNYASFFGTYTDAAIKAGKAGSEFDKVNVSIGAKEVVENTNDFKRKTEERIDLIKSELQARKEYAAEARRLQTEVNKNTIVQNTGGTLAGSGSQEFLSDAGVAAKKQLDYLNKQNKARIEVLKNKKEENIVSSSNAKLESDILYLNSKQAQAQDTYNKFLGKSLLLNKELEKSGRGRQSDPEAAILAARLRYLREYSTASKEVYELDKQIAQSNIDELSKLAVDEKRSFNDRINSYGEMLKQKQELLTFSFDNETQNLKDQKEAEQTEADKALRAELKQAGNSEKAKAAIRDYYAKETEQREIDYAAKRGKLSEKYTKDYLNIAEETAKVIIQIQEKQREIVRTTDKEFANSQAEIFKKASENSKLSLEIRQSNFEAYLAITRRELDIDKVRELAKAGDNQEEIDRIRQKYADLNAELDRIAKNGSPIALSIEQANNALQNLSTTMSDKFFGEAGLGSLKTFFDGTFAEVMKGFDQIEDKAEGSAKKAAYAFLTISETLQEVYNKIFSAINAASEARFEQEKSRLEDEKNIAISFAGESATAKEEIERQYEAKKREIARKQAESKKQAAIFNIILDTAQAVVSELAQGGYVAAAFAAALGLAELAVAESAQIPEYWKGTDNAPGGLAWTNERGAELHTDKFGNIKDLGSDKGAKLVKTDKGDKIYTAERTRQLMFDNGLNGILNERGISLGQPITNTQGMTDAQVGRIVSAIKSQPTAGTAYIAPNRDGLSELFRIETKQNRIISGRLRNQPRR